MGCVVLYVAIETHDNNFENTAIRYRVHHHHLYRYINQIFFVQ
jgi:hypothetical protein